MNGSGAGGVGRGSRLVTSTLNAAATAIISAENRVQQTTTKRKGNSFWSMYWCFGSNKHNKRMGHVLFISESDGSEHNAPTTENPMEGRMIVMPFVAPPSSPASFYLSEPPSAVQSPVNLFSVSSGMYSPSGPTNIFAIGPYANEPQLVSPPVFSTFTTEPSTAPVTPPPEYVHLTTPSSPEVPFARLLDPRSSNREVSEAFPLSQYEFQSYQYYPGSPAGQLISPRSGTSSPFLDYDRTVGSQSLQFPSTGRPKYLTLDKKPSQDWGSRVGSGSLTPDHAGDRKSGSVTPDSASHRKPGQDWGSRIGSGSLTPDSASRKSRENCIMDLQNYIRLHAQNIGKGNRRIESPDVHLSNAGSSSYVQNGSKNIEPVADHRVSFELSAMDVIKCVEKKQAASSKTVWTPSPISETPVTNQSTATSEEALSQRRAVYSIGSGSEFNFDNIVSRSGRRSDKLNIGSDRWANEKIVVEEGEPRKGWPFFSAVPAIESNVR